MIDDRDKPFVNLVLSAHVDGIRNMPDGFAAGWNNAQRIEHARQLARELHCDDSPRVRKFLHANRNLIPKSKPKPTPAELPGGLAVISAYFNPVGYESRRVNYKTWREATKRQGAEVFVVEVVFPGCQPDLPDAEIVVQAESWLWHKEAALTLMMDSLPDRFDKIAWVDADVLFENENWLDDTCKALKKWPVVQPFSAARFLDKGGSIRKWPTGLLELPSFGYVHMGLDGTPTFRGNARAHPGFAWAARRELFAQLGGMYSGHVIGGNDSLMALSFVGRFQENFVLTYNEEMRAGMHAWGDPAWEQVGGALGYVEGAVNHLYHGEMKFRRYWDRTKLLIRNRFDPRIHIRQADNGLYAWTDSCPPEVIAGTREYLTTRREDG